MKTCPPHFLFLALLLSAACETGPQKQQNSPSSAPAPAMTVELIAKKSLWTAHYPGPDGQLGKTRYQLVTANNPAGIDSTDAAGADDFTTTHVLHLPLDKPVQFLFRAIDVIHGAYFPHFRMSMNVVPGITTRLLYRPSKTTAGMRAETGKPNFDYLLLCNKICGPQHYLMQMKVLVETAEDFATWYKSADRENL